MWFLCPNKLLRNRNDFMMDIPQATFSEKKSAIELCFVPDKLFSTHLISMFCFIFIYLLILHFTFRYHGRGRFGIMEKVYCHYFVKLVEGPPPPPEARKTAVTHAKEYIQELRNQTIIHTL
ncbi:unnamed protein product [Nyctereutes procyonoides]|uniref:(raccoon dog) hypothetical protein n=1 Tax=Nyctereutes procyonoides TaxID=34880 RepID=A0A811ZLM6_NYCPR|nr:unnamed protein product [Nyctereutes procyonoides]